MVEGATEELMVEGTMEEQGQKPRWWAAKVESKERRSPNKPKGWRNEVQLKAWKPVVEVERQLTYGRVLELAHTHGQTAAGFSSGMDMAADSGSVGELEELESPIQNLEIVLLSKCKSRKTLSVVTFLSYLLFLLTSEYALYPLFSMYWGYHDFYLYNVRPWDIEDYRFV